MRLKVIQSHFCGRDVNVQPFMEIGMRARVHFLDWIARDDKLDLMAVFGVSLSNIILLAWPVMLNDSYERTRFNFTIQYRPKSRVQRICIMDGCIDFVFGDEYLYVVCIL